MNRRDWLRRAAGAAGAALAGIAVSGRTSSAQTPQARPDSAAGDPLYRPDLVQERPAATAADNDPIVKSLEHRLKCTCGCNLDIYTCRTTDFTCTYSPALHKELLDLRAAGQTPEQVVASFVAKYGEQILMAPPASGFNLAGYVVPGAAVLVVGTLIGAVLLRRTRMPPVAPAGGAPPSDSDPTPADQERLRRALADVED